MKRNKPKRKLKSELVIKNLESLQKWIRENDFYLFAYPIMTSYFYLMNKSESINKNTSINFNQ